MKGGLPTERLIEARNSWKRKRRARLDGARKPAHVEVIENLDGPFRTEFENAKEDAERDISLASVNSTQKLERIFAMGQEETPQTAERFGLERFQSMHLTGPQEPIPLNQPERSSSSRAGNSSYPSKRSQQRMSLAGLRERSTAARASREEDKEDFREKPNPLDPDDRGERHKMSEQLNKLSLSGLKGRHDSHHERRVSEKDAYLFQAQTLPDKDKGERYRFAESAKRKIHMAREELEAFRSSIADDIRDSKETGGNRFVNAMRIAKSRFENREAEKEAERRVGMRMSSGTGRPGERPRNLSNSQGPIFSSMSYGNSSSSSSSLPDASNPLTTERDSPPSPKALESLTLYNAPPAPTPRNRAYQQVFPARPSISYRPTLSPVYSKSPILTNSSSQLASTSPKPPKTAPDEPVDFLDEMAPEPVTPAPPKPQTGSLPPRQTEAGGRDFTRKLPPSSTSISKRDRAIQSANVISNLRKKPSYESQISQVVENDIPSLTLPSPKVKPVDPKKRPPRRLSNQKSLSLEASVSSTPRDIEIDTPQLPNPRETREPIHPNIEFSKTPTSSALEFWADADASLAPSESASAQPPNRIGEPPPDIWRDADRTLNLRKSKPTLEEWVASLPGLNPRQEPLEASGALNAQMLKELRTRSIKKSSSKHSKDAVIAALAEKLKDLEYEEPEQIEEFVPEDELELAQEEAKASEEESVPEYLPPLNIDPSLLHPDYRPNPSPSMILESISVVRNLAVDETRPLTRSQSYSPPGGPAKGNHGLQGSPPPRKLRKPRDLAVDVTTHLDTLQKYWDDQGIIVGTVLRRMLWIVDTMIVKEREEAQKLLRKQEMGWMADDGDDEGEEGEGSEEEEESE